MAKTSNNGGNIGFEQKLWAAADKLRNNMDPAVYKHVVLGLIFLKYISDAFEAKYAELKDIQYADPEDKDEYMADNVFWVPKEARWEKIKANAKQPEIGQMIDEAMIAIEEENRELQGVLNKDYSSPTLSNRIVGELIDLISSIPNMADDGRSEQDILGRVYEYFLGRFASAEGKGGGQFYTPTSVVRLLVEMIEPYRGRIFDPCCGSGGMFVQSEKFVQSHQGRMKDISIYGQESNPTTWRLCKMNLAIRGIANNLGGKPADSFHEDLHKDLRANYVLANPPFNDDDWGAKILSDDVRWKFGIPPEGNANFAWIQHIIHHLSPSGIVGIVMHGGAATNQGVEQNIREGIIKENLIDCIVQLPTQLFYNVSLPPHIWIINRDKSKNYPGRDDEILMIDASSYGYMEDTTHRVLLDKEINEIASFYLTWKKRNQSYRDISGKCKVVSKNHVLDRAGILAPNRYVDIKDEQKSDTLTLQKRIMNHINIMNKSSKEMEKARESCIWFDDLLESKRVAEYINQTDLDIKSLKVSKVIEKIINGVWDEAGPKKGYIKCKVIRGTDFPNIPLFQLEKVPTRYIREKKAKERQLIPGDLVVEMSGGSKDQPTGRCLYVTKEFLSYYDIPILFSNFCKTLRVNRDIVSPLWFYWYWKTSYDKGVTTRYENQPSGIKNFQLEEYIENEYIRIPKNENELLSYLKDMEKIITNSRLYAHRLKLLMNIIYKKLY